MNSINYLDELEDESLPFFDNGELILKSSLQWDTEVYSVMDYVIKLKNFLKSKDLDLTKEEVKSILKRKNPLKDSWKQESISELILDIKENQTLKDFFNEFLVMYGKHVRFNNIKIDEL